MIRIARVTLREIHLPLTEPFHTATGVVDKRRILLVELRDADGVTAWSECVAEALPTYSPETVDTCWRALSERILPIVLEGSYASASMVDGALAQRAPGDRMARAAIEMGAWAMEALHREVPLATLLAHESEAAQKLAATPRAYVESGIALGMHATPGALADRAAAALSQGYRRIKLKISPSDDFQFVRAVRDALGPDASLSVDANCSYSMLDATHVTSLKSLDSLGLAMIEQPLGQTELAEHAELQRLLATPICLDESITGDASVKEMLALGSARIVNLKPGRVGGFQESLAIHDRCAGAGIPLWCGGMLESGIGRAYNVALASLPSFTEPGDLSPSSRYWARDIVKQPWTMDEKGRVKVPLERPGIGVDVDESYVDDLTVRRAAFSAG